MKIFCTGACGFIGSHLCEALRDAGHEVTGMAWEDKPNRRERWDKCLTGIKIVEYDILGANLPMLVQGHDIVFHLAAEIDVAASFQNPWRFLETNLQGTFCVLEACGEAGAKLIHTSSSEVYGTALYTPQDEGHPLQAQSPYAASKIAADALVESYRRSYGLKAVTLRPFNTYGPRQSNRAVIARICEQATDREHHVIKLGNVDTKRDFMYVSDTVAAFMAVMGLDEGVYNAGTGVTTSIRDVAGMITDKGVCPSAGLYRPENSEVDILQCDDTKIANATGWEPKVSLEEGLKLTREWHDKRSGAEPIRQRAGVC